MAKRMAFMAKYGSSCDIPFVAAEFCDKNRQWAYLKPYLMDRPSQPWTDFSSLDSKSMKKGNKTVKRRRPIGLKKSKKM
jgi:hypothetical protein